MRESAAARNENGREISGGAYGALNAVRAPGV